MKITSDPSTHRAREQHLVQHVLKLLDDPRLRIDTTIGRRSVTGVMRRVDRSNHAMDLKRLMSEVGATDRELQNKMPIGEVVEVTLTQRKFLFLTKVVGRLRVTCISPTRSLLKGEEPKPMTGQQVTKALSEMPPPLPGVPTTVVLLSTSGFTLESHEAAERRPDRTLVLVEPNDAGGWSVHGPVETKAMVDLFDPEANEAKRQRVRSLIDEGKVDLLTSGIATDKLAAKSQLPLQYIEAELKTYAKENPGLVAKRLDGRLVLFREGTAPLTTAAGAAAGGANMPLIDRLKSLFARKGENEKKIALLSEQKAAFAQQLDRAYEDIGSLEKRDADLRDEFKNS